MWNFLLYPFYLYLKLSFPLNNSTINNHKTIPLFTVPFIYYTHYIGDFIWIGNPMIQFDWMWTWSHSGLGHSSSAAKKTEKKTHLYLGFPAVTYRPQKKNLYFWQAGGLLVARTDYGFFWAGLKSPEKIRAAIIRPRPYILFGLSGRPVRPDPFWQLYILPL